MSHLGISKYGFSSVHTRVLFAGITGFLLCGFASWISAGPPPEPPRVSEFAPVASLMNEVEYFTQRLEKSLKDEKKYSDSSRGRVAKDAATLGVLMMALGMSDEESTLKKSAPRLTELAMELVEASKDYNQASTAFAALSKGIQEGAGGGKPLSWKTRFPMEPLMKQVSTVNNKLKRNTKKEKSLAKRKDDALGQSALLAIIGQATLFDTHEVKDPTRLEEWYRYSAEMRDAAGAVHKAIAEDNYAAVQENVKRLQKNCDDCHEAFDIDVDD